MLHSASAKKESKAEKRDGDCVCWWGGTTEPTWILQRIQVNQKKEHMTDLSYIETDVSKWLNIGK